MTLLVYAITDGGPDAVVQVEGVAGRPVSAIGPQGLTAIVSQHEDPPALTADALWSFEGVVEAQMAQGAVIPARFGSVLADAPSVEKMLRDRRAELIARLEEIRGAVEFGVRVNWPTEDADPPPTGPDAGVSYMQGRLARAQTARELAARLELVLGDLARDQRYQLLTRPASPVTASYLVDRSHLDEFVTRVQDLAAATAGTELVCTGPWPPYSFVGQGSDG